MNRKLYKREWSLNNREKDRLAKAKYKAKIRAEDPECKLISLRHPLL